MANDEHVALLAQGVAAWNAWRDENPDIVPDLTGANLNSAQLRRVNLTGANLSGAQLRVAYLRRANLIGADLRGADLGQAHLRANLQGANLAKASLIETNLRDANLREADLVEANLRGATLEAADLRKANLQKASLERADLHEANLSGAKLSGADLRGASLVKTNLDGADVTGCRIYGISAWALKLDNTKQQDLVITHEDEPEITVDNLEVAQFIYLMLNNRKIRDVIDTVTSKAVLILGRFTHERKAVLDALRDELRKRNYLPILFDFDRSDGRDLTETISLLARMARFVVADITDAKSIPQELAVIVPALPSVPVQPLLLEGSAEYGMFEHFRRYPWVLETYRYPSAQLLISSLAERVIGPAESYVRSVRGA
jgi:pentapeptide repeat protein